MELALGVTNMVDENRQTPIDETSPEEVPQPLVDEEYNLPFTD